MIQKQSLSIEAEREFEVLYLPWGKNCTMEILQKRIRQEGFSLQGIDNCSVLVQLDV